MKTIFFISFAIVFIAVLYSDVQFSKQKNQMMVKNATISFVLYCLFLGAVYLFHLTIPFYVLELALLTVFINSFVGYYLDLYSTSQLFDRCFHAFGTFCTALLFFYTIINLFMPGGSRMFLALFVFTIGITAGTFFEILEFISDKRQRTHNQKGLQDTNFDILFNIIGSFLAAIFAYAVILP